MNPATMLTIGHSNHAIDHLVALLKRHHVDIVVDIRRFPSSRRFPRFNRSSIEQSLTESGVDYRWIASLGGRRKSSTARSPNSGLRDLSLRSFADYMLTAEFVAAADTLIKIASKYRTAIMCAEAHVENCHRQLLSDFLTANGHSVQHVDPSGERSAHRFTQSARFSNGVLTYPEHRPLLDIQEA